MIKLEKLFLQHPRDGHVTLNVQFFIYWHVCLIEMFHLVCKSFSLNLHERVRDTPQRSEVRGLLWDRTRPDALHHLLWEDPEGTQPSGRPGGQETAQNVKHGGGSVMSGAALLLLDPKKTQ